MSESARVMSVDAVKEFREALVIFCETVRGGLCANEMESRHQLDWLLNQQPAYWSKQLQDRQNELAQAQADLHQVKLRRAQGAQVDDIEQKKAVDRAKRRIEEAELKLENVRRWGRIVQQAINEYDSRARRLADLVEGNPPGSVLFLDRVVDSLEAYLRASPAATAPEPIPPAKAASKPAEQSA